MTVMTKLKKLAPVVALAVAVVFSTGMLQGQSSDRAKMLGGKLICMCNCGQILTACNHVGCTKSAAMLKAVSYTHLTLPTNREV